MGDKNTEHQARIAAHAEQVASLIFVADRAISVVQATGEGTDGINEANLGELFESLRDALVDVALLAVAKIFERATPRYPLWSLPTLLREIDECAEHLPLLDRPRALEFLRAELLCDQISGASSDPIVSQALVRAMLAQLPDASMTVLRPRDLALEALRQQRDKVIAHNEALDRGTLLSTSWRDLDGLLDLAKRQVGLIGWAFLNTVYMTDDGDYPLADDAARSGMAMRRLLTKAGLRSPRHWTGAI